MAPLNQPYDQFILFGDSLTQMSSSQDGDFGYQPVLQGGMLRLLPTLYITELQIYTVGDSM
jgi:hypothetical protein